MARPVADQVVVITGASSGIGRATAEEAARRGARVAITARNAHDIEDVARSIRDSGGDAIAVPADVTVPEQMIALADAALERWGRIDTWVNNAGVSVYATFDETTPDEFRQVMEINFFGQVNGARVALPHLDRSGGTLICVGSTLSDRGVPLQGAYCASKHAIKGWLDSLRVELARAGSKASVSLVKPSSIDTPLFNKARTKLGVMPRPISPVYPPELAAEVILEMAERPKREVFVGTAGWAFSVLDRISPSALDIQQRLQGFEGQRSEWPKSPDAPDNLFAPLEADGGVHGDFTRESHRGSAYNAVHRRRGLIAGSAAGVAMVGWALRRARNGTARAVGATSGRRP